MKPDKKLRIVARKVKQATAKQAESVPLDQPFPEELDQPLPEPPNHKEEAPEKQEKEADKPAEILPPEQDESEDQHKEDEKDKKPLVAGYAVSELAAAPIKPPEPIKTEGRRATKSPSVMFLMTLGVVLFLLGIVLIFSFNAVFGIIVALLGAAAVIGGVFVPLR